MLLENNNFRPIFRKCYNSLQDFNNVRSLQQARFGLAEGEKYIFELEEYMYQL